MQPVPPPSSDLDSLLNCPRGKFSVDLLNVLHPPFQAWRVVPAQRANVDFFGHAIRQGEDHYFRHTPRGYGSCDRLTLLSMDRLLWLTFGTNQGLVEFCQDLIKTRKAEEARQIAAYTEACNRRALGSDAG